MPTETPQASRQGDRQAGRRIDRQAKGKAKGKAKAKAKAKAEAEAEAKAKRVYQAPIGFFTKSDFVPGEFIAIAIRNRKKPYKFWPHSTAVLGHWVLLRESRTQTVRMAIVVDEEVKFDGTKPHVFDIGFGWRTKEQRGTKREWWAYRIAKWVTFEPRLLNQICPAQGGPRS